MAKGAAFVLNYEYIYNWNKRPAVEKKNEIKMEKLEEERPKEGIRVWIHPRSAFIFYESSQNLPIISDAPIE